MTVRYNVQTSLDPEGWVVRVSGQAPDSTAHSREAAIALAKNLARRDGAPDSRIYLHREDGTVERVLGSPRFIYGDPTDEIIPEPPQT